MSNMADIFDRAQQECVLAGAASIADLDTFHKVPKLSETTPQSKPFCLQRSD